MCSLLDVLPVCYQQQIDRCNVLFKLSKFGPLTHATLNYSIYLRNHPASKLVLLGTTIHLHLKLQHRKGCTGLHCWRYITAPA